MHAGRTRRVVGRALVGALLTLTFATTGLAGAEAAPVVGPAPGPVARLVDGAGAGRVQAHRATDRASLERAAEEADEDVFVSVQGSCAPSVKKSAKPDAVVFSTRKATFDWVLTSTSGYRKTGTVKVKRDGVVALKLPGLRLGSYRIAVTERGASSPVSDDTFEVKLCVQVKTSCKAVRFTNPASNPAADLVYGSSDEQTFELTLAPGEVRTVRVDDKKIFFSAWAVSPEDPDATPGDEEDELDGPTPTSLGRGTIKVKQSCKAKAATPALNAVQTSALVGCGAGAATGPVTFGWVAQKSLKNRTFEVVDASGAVAATGSWTRGRERTVQLAAGTYTYRAFANKKAQPFEETTFTVLGCVEVEPVCRALDLTNPNDVAVGLVVIDPALLDDPSVDVGDDPESDQLQERTLAGRASETVPWTSREAVVLAFADGADPTSRFQQLATPFPADEDDLDALVRVPVPQDC